MANKLTDAEILAQPDTRPSRNHGQDAVIPGDIKSADIADYTVMLAGIRSPRYPRLRIGWCPFCGRRGEVRPAYVYARTRRQATMTHRGYVMHGPFDMFMTVDMCLLNSADESRVSYGRKPRK